MLSAARRAVRYAAMHALATRSASEVRIAAVDGAVSTGSKGERVHVHMRFAGGTSSDLPLRILAADGSLRLTSVRATRERGPNPDPRKGDGRVFEVDPRPGQENWDGRAIEAGFFWPSLVDDRVFDAIFFPGGTLTPIGPGPSAPTPLAEVRVTLPKGGGDSLRQMDLRATSTGPACFSVVARGLELVVRDPDFELLGSIQFLERTDARLEQRIMRFRQIVGDLGGLFGRSASRSWAFVMRKEFRGLGPRHGCMLVQVDPTPLMSDGATQEAALAANAASAWFGGAIQVSGWGGETLRSAVCMAAGLAVVRTAASCSISMTLERLARMASRRVLGAVQQLQGLPSSCLFARQALALFEMMQRTDGAAKLRATTERYWGHHVPTPVLAAELGLT